MSMSHKGRIAGASVSWLALVALVCNIYPARADTVLDQEYTTFNARAAFSGELDPALEFRRAETFTVGVAGTLSEIHIFFRGSSTFTGLNILSTLNGVPTTNAPLATGSFQSADFDVTGGGVAVFTTSLPVTVGEVLAIEPIATGIVCPPALGDSCFSTWLNNVPGTYSGGGGFVAACSGCTPGTSFVPNGNADDFQTCVTTSAVGGNCPVRSPPRPPHRRPRPHRRCRTAGPDPGEWWSARLVATAAEDRLTAPAKVRCSPRRSQPTQATRITRARLDADRHGTVLAPAGAPIRKDPDHRSGLRNASPATRGAATPARGRGTFKTRVRVYVTQQPLFGLRADLRALAHLRPRKRTWTTVVLCLGSQPDLMLLDRVQIFPKTVAAGPPPQDWPKQRKFGRDLSLPC
jgi:hypothetical protein